MKLPANVQSSLTMVGEALRPARHDWWIISSAACALHGIDPGTVADIDVLVDARDLPAVLADLNLPLTPGGGDGLFRSRYFVRWDAPPLSVELFADFELCEAGVWNPIKPETRQWLPCGESRLPAPSRAELAAMLVRFGRPKDLARAALLSPSDPFPSRSETA